MTLLELANFLISQNQPFAGAKLDTDVVCGKVVESPDVLVAILPYPGERDEPGLGTASINYEYPRVQVLCRGISDDFQGPDTVARAIRTTLATVVNQNLSGTWYLGIDPLQAPFFLRRDKNDRVEIVCNYQVFKKPSA